MGGYTGGVNDEAAAAQGEDPRLDGRVAPAAPPKSRVGQGAGRGDLPGGQGNREGRFADAGGAEHHCQGPGAAVLKGRETESGQGALTAKQSIPRRR